MCKTSTENVDSSSVKKRTRPVEKLQYWIEIDGERYDTREFHKVHPGGHVINFYDGTDATDAFRNFHRPEILKNYAHLKMPRGSYTPLPIDPMIKEYRSWREQLIEKGLFKPRISFFVGQAAIALAFFFATFPLYMKGYWWLSVFTAGAAQVCFGWLMHDLGHRSVTTTRKGDSWWNTVIMQLFQGGSSNWWTSKHNRHHLMPNVMEKDPDIHTDPLFVWHELMKKGPWNKLQAIYFPIIGPPAGVVFMNLLVIRHAYLHREWITLAGILGFIVAWSAFFGPLHLFLMRVLQGLWFQWVVAVNHFGESVHQTESAKRMDWVRLVADTTVDVTGGAFLNWFTGHLNYQIEHHLFPRMPRCNYPLVAAETRAFFAKHKVHYGAYTPWQATQRLFRALANQGRVD